MDHYHVVGTLYRRRRNDHVVLYTVGVVVAINYNLPLEGKQYR